MNTKLPVIDLILGFADSMGKDIEPECRQRGLLLAWLPFSEWCSHRAVMKLGGAVLTNAQRDRLTVAANKFRAEYAALQQCERKLWSDYNGPRRIVNKSPIDRAHSRHQITRL